jgi:hypothetical protein
VRLIQAALLALFLLLPAQRVQAHEMSMAEMQVREMSRGEFLWQWSAGEKVHPSEVLRPIWPEGCRADAGVLRCGADGLSGTLAIEGDLA